jgi:hypothetical protein
MASLARFPGPPRTDLPGLQQWWWRNGSVADCFGNRHPCLCSYPYTRTDRNQYAAADNTRGHAHVHADQSILSAEFHGHLQSHTHGHLYAHTDNHAKLDSDHDGGSKPVTDANGVDRANCYRVGSGGPRRAVQSACGYRPEWPTDFCPHGGGRIHSFCRRSPGGQSTSCLYGCVQSETRRPGSAARLAGAGQSRVR